MVGGVELILEVVHLVLELKDLSKANFDVVLVLLDLLLRITEVGDERVHLGVERREGGGESIINGRNIVHKKLERLLNVISSHDC